MFYLKLFMDWCARYPLGALDTPWVCCIPPGCQVRAPLRRVVAQYEREYCDWDIIILAPFYRYGGPSL